MSIGFLTVLVFLFSSNILRFVVTPALALFSCIEVEANRYFLLADLEEECYKDKHLIMALTFGIFQIIVYVVGLPVLGFYFMYRNRFRLDKHVVRTRFGLFLGGYRDERYYWEMFLVGRKGESCVQHIFTVVCCVVLRGACIVC